VLTRQHRRWTRVICPLGIVVAMATSAVCSTTAIAQGVPVDTTTTTTTVPEVSTTVVKPKPKVLKGKDVKVVYKVKTTDPVVFITIDDGSSVTPSLAKYLDRNKIPVTTFAVSVMLWKHREWFRDRKRMTFENHTWNHAHMTLVSAAQRKHEVCGASQVARNVAKESPMYFRPPGGSFNSKVINTVAKCGMKYVVMWNVEADGGVVRMAGRGKLGPGDIILMHYLPSLERSLVHLMEQIKRNGLRPALLRDYLS